MSQALLSFDRAFEAQLAGARGQSVRRAHGRCSVDVRIESRVPFPVVPDDECSLEPGEAGDVTLVVHTDMGPLRLGTVPRERWPAPLRAREVRCLRPDAQEPLYRVTWDDDGQDTEEAPAHVS